MAKIDLNDIVVLVGLAMLAAGVGAYDWRLALIVCGTILVSLGVLGVYRRGHTG